MSAPSTALRASAADSAQNDTAVARAEQLLRRGGVLTRGNAARRRRERHDLVEKVCLGADFSGVTMHFCARSAIECPLPTREINDFCAGVRILLLAIPTSIMPSANRTKSLGIAFGGRPYQASETAFPPPEFPAILVKANPHFHKSCRGIFEAVNDSPLDDLPVALESYSGPRLKKSAALNRATEPANRDHKRVFLLFFFPEEQSRNAHANPKAASLQFCRSADRHTNLHKRVGQRVD